ncbi:hypothetical protein GGR52DRAFT_589147 [Hypoxylon sp. FL1284]|nr:hypothetical protein GGR52DRAFT_589147 [Hypoxylon sp. FL1284]
MVTPACYAPGEAGRRYSRTYPPYSIPYPERRYRLPGSEMRTTTMMEHEFESDSLPRKRISVACGRCRKRKIRCSGDPGNGLPCTNCKNARYEPCLFLRVSSTETQLRNEGGDFSYNIDAARPYSNQNRVNISPVNSISPDTATGDAMTTYRQSQYPYGSRGYYSAMSGWTGAFQDEGVDYGINYSQPMLGQDPSHMVQGYGRYGSGRSVYVDPEAAFDAYANLVPRPAVTSESPTGFSLSGMAASLPNATDRVDASDRLLSQVNRTLTSTSGYRPDGLPTSYADSLYSAPNALPSSVVPHRPGSGHHDGAAYHASATAASSSAGSSLYPPPDGPLRAAAADDAGNPGLSYIYSDSRPDGTRRDSQSSGSGGGGGSVLANGHVYVPDSHHAQHHVVPGSAGSAAASSSSYVAAAAAGGAASPPPSSSSSSTLSLASSGQGARAPGSSHMHADGHRRSAGNLRG